MKLVDYTIKSFLNEVDAPTPAPGGGSISALAVAQGISLIRMVAHLTISKKKFQLLDEKTKLDYMSRMASLDELKEKALILVDRDTEAFNKIMEAFKLPKTNLEEENIRKLAINKATIVATEVPHETATIANRAIELSYPMYTNANKTATSDFGVGIMMINAGLVGAILNVKTNMVSFSDQEIANRFLSSVKQIETEAKEIMNKTMLEVNETLDQ